jgi:conjugative transposon TraJ protein
MEVGSIIQELTDRVEPLAEEIGVVMGSICGIGALLYVGSKVWKSFSNGESLDLYALLRPFVIAFFVINFSIIKAPIDFLIGQVEVVNYGYFEKKFGTATEQAKRVQEKVKEDAQLRAQVIKAEKSEKLEDKNMFKRSLEYLKEGGNIVGGSIVGVLSTVVAGVLEGLLYLLKQCIVWFYRYVSLIYRCVLGVLGPIALTIAIFPGFSNGISNWLSKYVSICLWPIVFDVLNFIIVSVQTELICGIDYSEWWTIGFALSVAEWKVVFLTIIEVAVYLTVPTIVSWLVPNGDTNGALGGLKTIFSTIGSAVGAVAGAAVGGKVAASKAKKK